MYINLVACVVFMNWVDGLYIHGHSFYSGSLCSEVHVWWAFLKQWGYCGHSLQRGAVFPCCLCLVTKVTRGGRLGLQETKSRFSAFYCLLKLPSKRGVGGGVNPVHYMPRGLSPST